MDAETVLLLKDAQGARSGKKKGLLKLTPSLGTVCRGELLLKDKVTQYKDGETAHNFKAASDPSVTLRCTEDDVAPLSSNQFHLLKPIKSREACYNAFQKGLLDWASKLKKDDLAYVILLTNLVQEQYVLVVIRYIGSLQTEPGIWFGVEIVVCEVVSYYIYDSSSLHFIPRSPGS